MSDSIEDFGTIHPFLFGLYIFSLIICYFVIKNGVKTSGKIIVFTAMVPYIFFIILGIKGMFLDGAIEGLSYLFIPDFKKLFRV